MKQQQEVTKKDLIPKSQHSSNLALTEELQGAWGAEEATAEDIIIPKLLLMHGQSVKVLEGEKSQGEIVRSTDWETLAKKGETVGVIPFTMSKTWRISELVEGLAQWRRDDPFVKDYPYEEWEFMENGKKMRRDKALNFFALLTKEAELPTAFPVKLQFLRTSSKAGKVIADHFAKAKMLKRPPATLSFELGSEFVNGEKQKYFIFTAKAGKPTTIEQITACRAWYDLIKSASHSIKEHEVNETGTVSSTEETAPKF